MSEPTLTQRKALFAFLTIILGSGVAGVTIFLIDGARSMTEGILFSVILVGVASILCMAYVVSWSRWRWKWLAIPGVIAVVPALVLSLVSIWMRELGYWNYANRWQIDSIMMAAWTVAVASAHMCLFSLARLKGSLFPILRWTCVCIGALGCALIHTIFQPSVFSGGNSLIDMAIPILCILVVIGTISIPILHRISALEKRDAVHTTDLVMSIICPRCSLSQTLPVGRSACAKCKLRFTIDIEEDNCPQCGYTLYKLESASCPECGTRVTSA